MLIPKARAFDQLAAEKRWLRGQRVRRGDWRPPRQRIDIGKQVERILTCPELWKVIRALEGHNSDRSTPLLLAPHLFSIINSGEARRAIRQAMPVLGRAPAELRTHFQNASAKAKSLARLVRRGPQPLVALAVRDKEGDALFALFQPFPIIQSPNKREDTIPLDRLLSDAAAAFDEVSRKISPTWQHRKSTSKAKDAERLELTRLAASRLVTVFRTRLKHPYHSHVATIVTALTGITTDADYVKKIDKRGILARSSD